MSLRPLPDTYEGTRRSLHRLATHVLGRRRFEICGKFGLRATPGGFGTPACGPGHEVIRISGTDLVREVTGPQASTTSLDLRSASLADAVALAGVDLGAPYEAGSDTPAVGDPTDRLDVDETGAAVVADWFSFAWSVIDLSVASLGPDAAPVVVQLWPEHFDVGVDVAAAPGRRVNLGASPGDAYRAEPYLYVGPWDAERPGDRTYWNAPFGAEMAYDGLQAEADPAAAGVAFLLRGVALVGD